MANKSFVVEYLIKARDDFSRTTDASAGAMARLRKQAEKAGKAVRAMATRMRLSTKEFIKNRLEARKNAGAFKALSSSAAGHIRSMAAATAAFFTVQNLFAKGMAFETALADLSAITGATGDKLAFLRDESLRLAKASVVSGEKVATAFKLIASAKSELLKDPKGLSVVTEQVLLLANAARIDLAQAADVTTLALNQFQASASEAARFVNVLAAGSKVGASEVGATGAALVKVGSVARKSKLSFEELNAAIQVLAVNGQVAEIAGTGLKTVLLKLETQVENLRPSVVGFTTALENLAAGGTDSIRMTELFGLEATVIGGILADNAGKVRQWTRDLTGTNTAQQQAAVNTATFAKKLEKIRILIDGAFIRTFLRLEPILTKNAEAFAKWLEGVDPAAIRQFADNLGVVIKAAALVAKALGFIIEKLVELGKLGGTAAAVIVSGDFSHVEQGVKETAAKLARLAAFAVPGGSPLLQSGITALFGDAAPIKAPDRSAQAMRVDVGVNVALSKELSQVDAATVSQSGAARADVGGL